MKVCSTKGCFTLTERGKCEACEDASQKAKQQAYDRARGSSSARGYGTRWAKTSASLRKGALRWCGDTMPGVPPTGDSTCPREGLLRVPSQVIDHIVPVTGPKDPQFWNMKNLQGLCATDHDRKRQRESRTHRRYW